jgi:hypothetical protein
MRLIHRIRARMLVAGVGVVLAGTLTGCWDTPKRPANMFGGNIPKTNVNAKGTSGQPTGGAANWQGNSNPTGGGAPVNRTTGNPPLYDQKGNPTTGGPLGSTSSATGADYATLPSPPSKSNDQQPIATNGPKQTSGIRPVSRVAEGPGNVDDPLQLPLHDSAAPTGPAVAPISAQPLDGQPKVRSAPPRIPVDSLESTAPPKPNKPGTLLPPITSP